MRSYFDEMNELNAFFKSSDFFHYYPDTQLSANCRAFFIAIVPHLCMCFELHAKTLDELAINFIVFIRHAQAKRIKASHAEEFNSWFNEQLLSYDIRLPLEAIFFSAIHKERSFCEGQLKSLEFKQKALHALTAHRLIEPAVTITDSKNLNALHLYYADLPADKQDLLLRELVMVLVLQAGATRYLNNRFLISNRNSLFTKSPFTLPSSKTESDDGSICCVIG